jgi:hypothetical protein
MKIPIRKTTESTRESWERTDFELSLSSILSVLYRAVFLRHFCYLLEHHTS